MFATALAAAGAIVALAVLARFIDGAALGDLMANAADDPDGALLAVGAFGTAFLLRSVAWRRLLPALSLGQSLAAIHVALGANHVLPFRLGEPMRVVSALARTPVSTTAATATGVALRLGDILGLLFIAAIIAPSALLDALGLAGSALAAVASVAAVGAIVVVFRMAARRTDLQRPDATVAVLTLIAWWFESVLVWRVAGWGGVDLSLRDALLVTVVAVAAQLVAIAPGGIGSYEAAAVAAMVFVGVDPGQALVVAVAAHLLKTLYSVISGIVFTFWPAPGLVSGLRLPASIPAAPIDSPPDGPVVLFLPAHNEGPRIAEVIGRAPPTAGGRPLHVLVIDDGSTDETVAEAERAGATVRSLQPNRGLGRAVAVGFVEAIERFDASVVVFCDADGEYDPAEIDTLVAPILADHADYVVGSRFAGTIRRMQPHRRFGNQMLTRWVRWMTRRPVSDGQSGYRALSRQAAANAVVAHDYNYAQVLTIDLLQRGFRYVEVPIGYRFRESGESFVKLGCYLRAVVPTVIRQITSGRRRTDAALNPPPRDRRSAVGLEPSLHHPSPSPSPGS